MFGVGDKNFSKQKKKSTRFKLPQETKRYHKVLTFIVAGIFIGLLICYYLYMNHYDNYNYIKKDTSKYLVFTKYSKNNSDRSITEVPEINIDSRDVTVINKKINSFAKKFLSQPGNKLSYETQVNGEVLSLLLKMVNVNTGYVPEVDFYTYNINLKKKKLMSQQELLSLYGVTEESVKEKIQNQFESFYNDEVAKGYIVAQECNYDCFLEWRNIKNYMDSVHYYIENGKLIIYRPFSIYSVYGEEKYFKEEDFKFYING